jgi:hypothetical protein
LEQETVGRKINRKLSLASDVVTLERLMKTALPKELIRIKAKIASLREEMESIDV